MARRGDVEQIGGDARKARTRRNQRDDVGAIDDGGVRGGRGVEEGGGVMAGAAAEIEEPAPGLGLRGEDRGERARVGAAGAGEVRMEAREHVVGAERTIAADDVGELAPRTLDGPGRGGAPRLFG